MRLEDAAAFEIFNDSRLLFSSRRQQLLELNQASAVLAYLLQGGATRETLIEALTRIGIVADTAASWVSDFLRDLSSNGMLELAEFDSIQAAATQNLSIAGCSLNVVYGSVTLRDLIAPPYDPLVRNSTDSDCKIHLVEVDEFVGVGERPTPVVERIYAATTLKGRILEHVLAHKEHLLALHAACMIDDAGAVLLLGSPGAGKTTLSVALLAEGLSYGSDDVTLISNDGSSLGVPLPIGAKEGAWPQIASSYGDLSGFPIHLRPDGQKVRYLVPPGPAVENPTAVKAVVRLRRTGDSPPSIVSISSAEAMTELLRESRALDGRCSIEIVQVLGQIIRGARCLELRYTEASAAARLLWRSLRDD